MDENPYIPLALARKQTRVDLDDGDYDDDYLIQLSYIAIDHIEAIINDKFSRLEADEGKVPYSLIGAALLMLDHLYNNRGATISTGIRGVQELPLGVEDLIWPYRRLQP